MGSGIKLFQLLTALQRQHGMLQLDHAARIVLDIIIERELANQRTTASEIVESCSLSRALVYRKLIQLKSENWISESWHDQKLCYASAQNVSIMVAELDKRLKLA